MSNELARWNNFKKLGLNVSSKFVWLVSIVFSLLGFVGFLNDRTSAQASLPEWLFYGFVIIGIGLSIVVNMLELALNSEQLSKITTNNLEVNDVILWVGGIVAYLYDIYTNVIGLSLLMQGTINLGIVPTEGKIIVIVWGVLLAILPEPMYIKSLRMKYTPAYNKPPTSSKAPAPPSSSVSDYLAKKYPDQFKGQR